MHRVVIQSQKLEEVNKELSDVDDRLEQDKQRKCHISAFQLFVIN